MPEALLTVDQEVERDPDEMRHIGRRDPLVRRGLERLPRRQGASDRDGKVELVMGREEGCGANDEMRPRQGEKSLLHARLALAIDVARVGRVGFDIGPFRLAPEDEVA